MNRRQHISRGKLYIASQINLISKIQHLLGIIEVAVEIEKITVCILFFTLLMVGKCQFSLIILQNFILSFWVVNPNSY